MINATKLAQALTTLGDWVIMAGVAVIVFVLLLVLCIEAEVTGEDWDDDRGKVEKNV